MEIAALIISTLSLVVSVVFGAIFIGREYFSSHKIQMVPAGGAGMPDFGQGMPSPLGFDPYADFEQPLTPDEQEKLERKKQL